MPIFAASPGGYSAFCSIILFRSEFRGHLQRCAGFCVPEQRDENRGLLRKAKVLVSCEDGWGKMLRNPMPCDSGPLEAVHVACHLYGKYLTNAV